MTAPIKKLRCAVYTRKSSEEGLEQAFNSLDAQREAGVAYIASQKHEGWELLSTHYDDGGYSGGTTERPALKKLLSDIEANRIDVIVVYKVDRLSRSLHGFSQMMTLFDKQDVAFVSVTQQFNTTTSMGRLTLNILLSFAQFEREVTGERIRDKFAASKQKGIFMGGNPPLGYQVIDRKLTVIETEAELVRKIFHGYLQSHSLLKLAETLNAEGHTTKHWTSRNDRVLGGNTLKPTYLNYILRNHIYRGKINHKGKIYDGQHDAIIDEETWQQIHDFIKHQNRNDRHRWNSDFLLKGKMKTHEGFTMSPTSTHKDSSQTGKRTLRQHTRYYVSRKAMTQGFANCSIRSLNASLLEELVKTQLLYHLMKTDSKVYQFIISSNEQEKSHWIRHLVDSIVIGPEHIVISISKKSIADIQHEIASNPFTKKENGVETKEPVIWNQPEIRDEGDKIILTISILIRRMNGIRAILSADGKDITLPSQPKADPSIVQAIGRGFSWKQMLNENPGLSLKKFEAKVGYCDSFITKQISLVGLAPDILHRALSGTLPPSINLTRLTDAATSLSWTRQREMLCLN